VCRGLPNICRYPRVQQGPMHNGQQLSIKGVSLGRPGWHGRCRNSLGLASIPMHGTSQPFCVNNLQLLFLVAIHSLRGSRCDRHLLPEHTCTPHAQPHSHASSMHQQQGRARTSCLLGWLRGLHRRLLELLSC